MNAKEILKKAFDSDSDLYKRYLESDSELLKQFLKYISKLIIKLVEKGVLTIDDMQELLTENEIDKQMDEKMKDIKIGDE